MQYNIIQLYCLRWFLSAVVQPYSILEGIIVCRGKKREKNSSSKQENVTISAAKREESKEVRSECYNLLCLWGFEKRHDLKKGEGCSE